MSDPAARVLLATPAYGGQVTTGYTHSVLELTHRLKGVQFTPQFVDYPLVCKVRNFYISRLLQEDFTHLLFVDADMAFPPEAVRDMLQLNVPIAACAYPARTVDWTSVSEAARANNAIETVKANALNFVFGEHLRRAVEKQFDSSGTELTLYQNKFVRCGCAGTGLMLIQKTAAQQLLERYPELWLANPNKPYTDFGSLNGILQCFEALQNEDGQFVGEDVSFCRRWSEGCGGDVWVNIRDRIAHTGTLHHVGAYLDKLV